MPIDFDQLSTDRVRVIRHAEKLAGAAAMNEPRFRIASLMVFIAIAALDFAAIRAAAYDLNGPGMLLCTVVLPMANVLALALLLGHRNRRCRRWLSGFEAFGLAALVYFVVAILSDEDWVWSYITLALEPTRAIIRPSGGGTWSAVRLFAGRSVLSVWATLPQLAFALIGGYIASKFKGTITHRVPSIAPQAAAVGTSPMRSFR